MMTPEQITSRYEAMTQGRESKSVLVKEFRDELEVQVSLQTSLELHQHAYDQGHKDMNLQLWQLKMMPLDKCIVLLEGYLRNLLIDEHQGRYVEMPSIPEFDVAVKETQLSPQETDGTYRIVHGLKPFFETLITACPDFLPSISVVRRYIRKPDGNKYPDKTFATALAAFRK